MSQDLSSCQEGKDAPKFPNGRLESRVDSAALGGERL